MTTPHANPTALITGATRGLGSETARRLAGFGWTLWLGARDVSAGEETAAKIQVEAPDADLRVVQLDVTSDDSVASAYSTVRESGTGLDVLVNNAGITGSAYSVIDTVPADFLPVFGVNVLGPVRVTHTFLPLLQESQRPRLVMVSSGMGSLAVTSDPERVESTISSLVYPSSKAALNMITSQYAKALPGMRVNAVDPGYTATELNDFSGPQTITEGTDAIVRACTADDVPGRFFDRNDVVPW